MNYLDELLIIYDGQPDPLVRKYLLSAMGLRPLTFASQDLVELLWGQISAGDSRIRHAARRELGRVLPRHLRRDYGLETGNASVWTGYYKPRQAAPGTNERWTPAWTDKHRAAIDAGFQRLYPAARKAVELARGGPHLVRQTASLVAGRVPLDRISSALAGRLASGDASFHDIAALSELGTPEAHELMLACARKYGLAGSDVLSLLSAIPPELTLPVLEAVESRTDAYGRTNIAVALGQDRSPRGRALLARLAKRREGWSTAHVLDVLQTEPLTEDLGLIQSIFEQETHDFLRVLAIRTAGYAIAPATVQFVKARAQDNSQRVRAAALEALARMRVSAESLAEVAAPLADLPLLKARVTAMLVLAQTDAERVGAETEKLLFSPEPIQRLEGAYVLGYLAGAESAGALTEMALHDQDPDVRCQAVKSLARQPERLGLERLVALLAASDPKVARLAARALPLLDPAALPQVLSGLDRAIRATASTTLKTAFLRSAGMAASRLQVPVPAVVTDHLASDKTAEVWGALEALKFQLGAAPDPRVASHFTHADPRVRTAAAVAAFWAGHEGAAPVFENLLSSGHEESVVVALNALFECAALLPRVIASNRCAAFGVTRTTGDAPALYEVRLDPLSQQAGATLDEEWVAVEAPAALTSTLGKLRLAYGATPPPVDNLSIVADGTPLAKRARKPDADLSIERSVISAAPAPRRRKTVKQQMPDLNALAEPTAPTAPKGVLAAAALLTLSLVVASVYLRGRGPTPSIAAPVHTFEVDYVKGKAHRAGIEGPVSLTLGKRVASGDQLETGGDAQLSAKSPEGPSLWLDPQSRLTLGASTGSPRADAWFSDPKGTVTLDLRRQKEAAVWAPPCLIRLQEALIKISDESTGRMLTVQAGKVEVDGIPGGPRLMTDGMREALPR